MLQSQLESHGWFLRRLKLYSSEEFICSEVDSDTSAEIEKFHFSDGKRFMLTCRQDYS